MLRLLLAPAALLAALAIACEGDSESAPSATTTPRTESTATRPAPTATTASTATPIPPTATPEPPTPEPPTPEPEPPTPEPPGPPVDRPPFGGPPSGGPPSGPPTASGPVSVTITASGLQFATRTINARAGASVTITLQNNDFFVAHDIAVAGVASVPSCTGICTSSATFTAPGPGTYPFLCTIHPDMTGTLRVAP